MNPTIGIIGGSGLYSMPGFEAQEERKIDTPWGAPSDAYIVGKLAGKQVAFLARHARGHRYSPSELNFRANIWGFKSLGVERILSISAVGSLKEEHKPLDFVVPYQFVDRTRGRISTFFGEGIVAHVSFAHPVCSHMADIAHTAGRDSGVHVKLGGSYLCMEGPAFSTLAESNLYRSWGMDIIGMTALQEAKLAREAELCYTTVAMVTDYDCWHPEHDAVTVEDIIANLTQNAANAAKLVHAAVAAMPAERTCKCGSALKHAIMTDPKTIPAPTRRNWSFWLENICREVLELCLDGQRVPDDLLRKALAQDEGRTFLSTVVEPLADSFEPHLCDVYAALFRRAVEIAEPELMPRVWRAPSGALPDLDPEHLDSVYVLSRVTLGADVAVTSVVLDAAKRKYPESRIIFVGSSKNYELFAADPRIELYQTPYARSGSLHHRLAASACLWFSDGIVIDPDSRLTQLGLMRVCGTDRYSFFESRSFGGDTRERLPDLAAQWCGDIDARPYIAPAEITGTRADITVSLGTGDNPAKQLDHDFESRLMRVLAETGADVLVDLGASPQERARVESVLQPNMRVHDGSFASFAAEIARSELYIGYDSAGGHVASATGVPVISIARGFLNERMAARWRPLGTIIDGDGPDPLEAVRTALPQ